MTDKPKDRPEERRRTGPLGEDDRTRAEPARDQDATRQIPSRQGADEEREPPRRLRRASQSAPPPRTSSGEDAETRAIRTPAAQDTPHDTRESSYPRGYFEAAEDREDRLRDMYGGVDWLASFLGFVFAVVVGAILTAVAGVVLGPLGFSLDLSGELGAAVITGLVLLGVLIFLTYFFGGYVSGRLARFDGGRNGAMLLVWTFLTMILLALAAGIFSGFLPSVAADAIGGFVDSASSTVGDLSRSGVVGISVVVGALLLALLGGFLGGRLGSRYHAEIDRTS